MPDWEALVEENASTVWRTCYRILRDHDAAADCVQETFLSALETRQKSSVRDWTRFLICIATRRALDQLRGQVRNNHRHEVVEDLESLASLSRRPEEVAVASELAERLRTALAELPSPQAEVFCLRCFNDLAYSDIAKQLGLETSHVGVLLHRARQQLQQLLQEKVAALNSEKAPCPPTTLS